MKYRLLIPLSALLVVDAPWPVRSAEPPPPKVRRSYGERVVLHDPSGAPVLPKEDADNKVKQTAPVAATELPGIDPSAPPPVAPPPRPRDTRSDELGRKDDDPLSSLRSSEPAKSTGWGWLADEVMQSSQPTSPAPRVELDNWKDEDDDFGGSEADRRSGDSRNDEAKQARPEREDRRQSERDGTESVAGLDLKWRPVETTAQRPDAWSLPSDPEREFSPGMPTGTGYGISFSTPDYLRIDLRTRDLGAGASAEVVPEREMARSAFNRTESALPPPAASFTRPEQATVGFGASTPTPLFGSLGAVDIQPSLAAPTPVTPALSLPSQSTTRPSLGEMGTEMERQPRALSW